MEFTGERLQTEINGQIAIEHLHRYAIAKDFVEGKVVLDIASGEGYGTHLMAETARETFGVDISEEAVKHASNKYKKSNLKYIAGSAEKIPFENEKFDVVVSYETIEHLVDHQKMIDEIKRVMKKDGVLIISSPDKKKYTDETGHNNAYHLKELYFDEFKKLISSNFAHCHFYLQGFMIGSLLFSENNKNGLQAYDGDFSGLHRKSSAEHTYNLAIASAQKTELLPTSCFEGKDLYFKIEDYYKERIDSFYRSKSFRIGNFFVKIYNKLFR